MADLVCKRCDSQIDQSKESIKCVDCGGVFHLTCVGFTGEKKVSSRRYWKCEGCVGETSSTGSRGGESTTLMEAIMAFRKEVNGKLDQSFVKLTKVEEDINSIKLEVGTLNVQYGELKIASDQNSKYIEELRTSNAKLGSDIRILTREVEELQQHTRKNNIIIMGVPVTKQENLFRVLELIARMLELEFRRYEISAAHRLPPLRDDNRPPSIVVCFVSRQVKDEWMRARTSKRRLSAKDLSDSFPDETIYLNEHLTRQTREIFNGARALAKIHKLEAVWIKDCRVLVKKTPTSAPFRLHSLRQLRDLGGLPPTRDEDIVSTPGQ